MNRKERNCGGRVGEKTKRLKGMRTGRVSSLGGVSVEITGSAGFPRWPLAISNHQPSIYSSTSSYPKFYIDRKRKRRVGSLLHIFGHIGELCAGWRQGIELSVSSTFTAAQLKLMMSRCFKDSSSRSVHWYTAISYDFKSWGGSNLHTALAPVFQVGVSFPSFR